MLPRPYFTTFYVKWGRGENALKQDLTKQLVEAGVYDSSEASYLTLNSEPYNKYINRVQLKKKKKEIFYYYVYNLIKVKLIEALLNWI